MSRLAVTGKLLFSHPLNYQALYYTTNIRSCNPRIIDGLGKSPSAALRGIWTFSKTVRA
jgi:hypothetical protein